MNKTAIIDAAQHIPADTSLVHVRRPRTTFGLGRINRLFDKVRRRISPPPLLLLYHRVADVATDPQLLCVSPANFREQLEVLAQHYRVLAFHEFIETLQLGRVPPKAAVITFDDGYLDNLEHAKPALEAAGIPALIYIPTGFVGTNRKFWWDELENLLLHPGTLPATLTLHIKGVTHTYPLEAHATYTQEHFELHQKWNVLDASTPTPRHQTYRVLCELLRPLTNMAQQQSLAQIANQLTKHQGQGEGYRCVSREELLSLARGNLVDFGAHTVTHCSLDSASPEQQREEITQSIASLEAMLDRPVTTFAYPYGNYTAESVRIVRDAGVRSAVTTQEQAINPNPNFFELPRVIVRNWDGATFERKLTQWQRCA